MSGRCNPEPLNRVRIVKRRMNRHNESHEKAPRSYLSDVQHLAAGLAGRNQQPALLDFYSATAAHYCSGRQNAKALGRKPPIGTT